MKIPGFKVKAPFDKTIQPRSILARLGWILAVSLILVPLNGCDVNIATITYEQVGLCTHYVDANGGDHDSGPAERFAVFAIDSIDTTQSKVDFNFDPSLLTVFQDNVGVVVGQVNMLLTANVITNLSPRPVAATQQTVQAKTTGEESQQPPVVVAQVTVASDSNLVFSLNYPIPKGGPLVNVVQNPSPVIAPPAGDKKECSAIY